MGSIQVALSLSLSLLLTLKAPCVEDGACSDVQIDAPAIDGEGMPVGAEYVSDADHETQIMEEDRFSSDDQLDTAAPRLGKGGGSASATVTICNEDGTLTAPTGESGDGLGNDCFEVYGLFWLRYPVTLSKTLTVKVETLGVGVATSQTVSWTVWKYKAVKSRITEVCPC